MKRLFFIFLALGMFTVFTSSVLGENEAYDFRNSNWGDSYQKVLITENADLYDKKPSTITYKTSFATLKCLAMFGFKNDELDEAVYLFSLQHTNQAEYLADYIRVKNQLIERYGIPSKSVENWTDNPNTGNVAKQGSTTGIGYFENSAEWQSDRTHVVLKIININARINMYLTYSSTILKTEPAPQPKKWGKSSAPLKGF